MSNQHDEQRGAASGSDSDSSSEDEASEEMIRALEAGVAALPNKSQEAHELLIRSLRSVGMLDELRAARTRMTIYFEPGPETWCDWLSDESKLVNLGDGPSSQPEGAETLHIRATKAWPARADVWFSALDYAAALGIDASTLRSFEQSAVKSPAGMNIEDGHKLWTRWAAAREPLRGKDLSLLAAVPLRHLEELKTLALKAQNDNAEALKASEAASDTLAELEAAESKLAAAQERLAQKSAGKSKTQPAPEETARSSLVLWKEYVSNACKQVAKPLREHYVRGVYERAALDCGNLASFWGEWIQWCISSSTSKGDLYYVAYRATLRCPTCAIFWVALFQGIEQLYPAEKQWPALVQGIGMAVGKAMQAEWPANSADAVANVLLATCNVYRRLHAAAAALGGPGSHADTIGAQLKAQYDYALSTLRSLFPRAGPAAARLLSAKMEWDAGNSRDCFSAWTLLLDDFSLSVPVYTAAIQCLQTQQARFPDWMMHCRKILKRGLHAFGAQSEHESQRFKLANLWVDLEGRHAALGDLQAAQRSVKYFTTERSETGAKGKRANGQKKNSSDDRAKNAKDGGKELEKSRKRKQQEHKGGESPNTRAEDLEPPRKQQRKTSQGDDKHENGPTTGTSRAAAAAGEESTTISKAAVDREPTRAKSAPSSAETVSKQPEGEVEKRARKAAKSVFVTNLDFSTTSKEVAAHFKPICGAVAHVTMQRNPRGKPTGRALVEFKHVKGAATAIEQMQATNLKGRPICVEKYQPRRDGAPKKQETRSPPALGPKDEETRARSVYVSPIPCCFCTAGHLSGQEKTSDEMPFIAALLACGKVDAVEIAKNGISAVVTFCDTSAKEKALLLDQKHFSWGDPSREAPVRVKTALPLTTAQQPSRKAAIALVPAALRKPKAKVGTKPGQSKPSATGEINKKESNARADEKPKSNDYFASLFKK